jgi:transposase
LLDKDSQSEATIAQLRLENSLLKNELSQFKARLSQNSNNSNKPPSSDGYAKSKPAIPKFSNKTSGGQVGHKGKTLKMTALPDEIVKHHPLFCSVCSSKLNETNVIEIGSKHQVFDLPVQKLLVIEHQLLLSQCSCGCQTKAYLPSYLANSPTQYGPNIKSLAVYLNSDFKIPFQKISVLFKDLYGYSFNQATALNANQRAFECLEPIENQIKEQITMAKVAHADETGIRCNGVLQWLHVTSSNLFTYFFIHQKRGGLAIESAKSILQDCKNYLMHDCWSPYFNLPKATHLVCNAHLIRELQALIEQDSHWASSMQKFLLELFENRKKQILPQELIPKYIKEFHQICQQGFLEEPPPTKINGQRGRTKKSKGRNLLERLSSNQDAILSFAFHEEVPFTNNQAERDLRTVKTKQKVSACFRANSGADHYARIQGFISTMRKHNLNPFQQLKFALQNQFMWQSC